MSNGKIVLGVLAGLAAGAVLGILFAPDKGAETRRKISEKSNDTSQDLREQLETLLKGLGDKFEAAQKDGTETAKNVKNA